VEGPLEAPVEVALAGRHEVLVELMLVTIGRGPADCGLAVYL
jgi:hypothetical protein